MITQEDESSGEFYENDDFNEATNCFTSCIYLQIITAAHYKYVKSSLTLHIYFINILIWTDCCDPGLYIRSYGEAGSYKKMINGS